MLFYEALHYIGDELLKRCDGIEVFYGFRHPSSFSMNESSQIINIYRSSEDEEYVNLAVALWIREDSPELDRGYEKLAIFEQNFFKAIQDLNEELWALEAEGLFLLDNVQLLSIEVESTAGDDGSLWPAFGSETSLKLRIHRHREVR
ncbi:hypothetical protein [Veillonella sp.]|uniref:hypothetical protein n=1 Tax=Veillonella sp. TaxID=1926307 RepID=UPI0025F131A2|nr:hypothetical protein [Veillonella sp.]